MKYNTELKRIPMPEYGRSVQEMVDHVNTIEDRTERQRCANTIINIMGNMFPHLRDVNDFKHKLWDHLAIMSDFSLDIDYPYEIIKKENLFQKPTKLPYQDHKIKYRHYGRIVENLIQKAIEVPEGIERNQLLNLIANQMKKSYVSWNKEGVEDQKIRTDLKGYINNRFEYDESLIVFTENSKPSFQKRPKPTNGGNNNSKGEGSSSRQNNHSNNNRRYSK